MQSYFIKRVKKINLEAQTQAMATDRKIIEVFLPLATSYPGATLDKQRQVESRRRKKNGKTTYGYLQMEPVASSE